MNRFRGLRAMLVITLTWAVFWGVVGPLFVAVAALAIGASGPFSGRLGQVWWLMMSFAVLGAAMGLGFSGLIALLGRRDGWSLTRDGHSCLEPSAASWCTGFIWPCSY